MEMKQSIKITVPNFQSIKSEDLKEIIGGDFFLAINYVLNLGSRKGDRN